LVLSDLTPCVEEQLQRCDLSLHLVGRNFGIVPDGSDSSMVELQYEAAAQGLAGHLTRLVWLDGSAEIKDERQKALVARLRDDPRLGQRSDLLETSFEDLKTVLYRRLETPAATAEADWEATAEGPKRNYLLCTESDLAALGPLQDCLFEQGFEVVTPVFEGDEAEIRSEHDSSPVKPRPLPSSQGSARERLTPCCCGCWSTF
jgi:hypothetical protein